MSYYDTLINQYQRNQAPMVQKTPEQIAQEQKDNTYQVYLGTKEGVEAIAELKSKFEIWYAANYIKQPIVSEDVKDLKEMFLKMVVQNEAMAAQIESLTNQLK